MFPSEHEARIAGLEHGRQVGERVAAQDARQAGDPMAAWEAAFREGFEEAAGRPPTDAEVEMFRPRKPGG